VTLTAVVPAGHHFVGWSGDASGTDNPLALVMDGNKSITATFAINMYVLNLDVIGSGTVLRSPSLPSYEYGRTVQLFAYPAPGNHFVGWSGDTSGTATPLLMVMRGDRNVTARFEIDVYALNVSAIGGGTVVRNPDQGLYPYGATVQLTAVPDLDHHFRDWIGDASGMDSPIMVTMDRERSITARFLDNVYAIDVITVGQATYKRWPDQQTYDPGTKVDLDCIPAPGYQFVNWSWNDGRDTTSINPICVTLDSSLVLTATLVEGPPPTLTVLVDGNGQVTRSPNEPPYAPGTWVELTAVPAPDHHFVKWTGTRSPTANPLMVFIDRDKTITATFASSFVTLNTVVTQGSGTVHRDPDLTGYPINSAVQITAVPGPGYHFLAWAGDTSGTANPLSVVMDRNKTIEATFGFAANVTVSGSGTVSRSPNQPVYAPGSTMTLTAAPRPGYRFGGWSGDASGMASPLIVTMDSDKNITATFFEPSFQLEVLILGNGSVAGTPEGEFFAPGSLVSLLATPDPGWHFVGWENCPVDQKTALHHLPGGPYPACASSSGNPLTVKMDGARQVTATFEININLQALVLDVVGAGSVAQDPETAGGSADTAVVLTAKPAPGWAFDGWSGDLTGRENPVRVRLAHRLRVTANFIESGVAVPVVRAPAQIALDPPSPNPTRGAAQIGFAIPRETRVRLSVLDLQGREVVNLADAVYPPGRYQTTWNGRTERGSVPAGVYFVRLRAEGKDLVRRLHVSH
jgi:hypothetical protein